VSEFLFEFREGGQLKGGSIDAADWAAAEAMLERSRPGAAIVGRAAPLADAPPRFRSVARIIADSRGDWLDDPDFNGWDVKQ